jgi:hypothetical protein
MTRRMAYSESVLRKLSFVIPALPRHTLEVQAPTTGR